MATDTPVNVGDLNGLFKRVYADNLENLIPDNAVLIKKVKFEQKKRLGDTFEQPVILQQENGVTYAAAGSGAFALNAPINMATKNARVPSVQMLLRSQMDYEAASRASGGNDNKAFFNSTKLMIQSMLESLTHRLECSMLYGGSGLATLTSVVNIDDTHATLLINAATWAMGIWTGCEGAQIDLLIAAGTSIGNTNAALVIDSIDMDTRKIIVSGNATDIAAIDNVSAGINQIIYWRGTWASGTNPDMEGIDKIITNTGTLF